MARVNVEETSWKRFYRLANFMDWALPLASGSVLSLWHESQEKLRAVASSAEIARWSGVRDQSDAAKYISGLLDADLIRVTEDCSPGEYEIVGNDSEIESQMRYRARSKKGGEATRAKWEANKPRKSINKASSIATSPPQAGQELGHTLGTVQCSSVQFNSDLKNKEAGGGVSTSPQKPGTREQIAEAHRVWGDSVEAMGSRRMPLNPSQERVLQSAIGSLGFETVCLALEGQRYEARTEKFNPAEHLSLERVLTKDRHTGKSHWEKLAHLALERREKANRKRQADEEFQKMREEFIAPEAAMTPEDIHERMQQIKEQIAKNQAMPGGDK